MSKNMNETKKDAVLDSYDDFQRAVLDIHTQIDEVEPVLEVSDKLFLALAKGKKLNSLTYGHPGIRVYPIGTREKVDAEERMSADQYRELELKRMNGRV